MRLKFIACKYTVFIQAYDLNRLVFLLQTIKKRKPAIRSGIGYLRAF